MLQKLFFPGEIQWENKLPVADLYSVVSSVTDGSDPKHYKDEAAGTWETEKFVRKNSPKAVFCFRCLAQNKKLLIETINLTNLSFSTYKNEVRVQEK